MNTNKNYQPQDESKLDKILNEWILAGIALFFILQILRAIAL